VKYTTTRLGKPKRVVIQLAHTKLGNTTRAKLKEKGFPNTVTLTESKNGKVLISLDMETHKKYKLLTLKRPNRLVVDLYPAAKQHAQPKVIPSKQTKSSPVKAKRPPPQKPGKGLVIILDPGHGGKDPGATGKKGTKEKHIVLNIARRLKTLIKERLGAKVLMTREKDTFIALEDRAEFANNKKADLFVSIHVNSHPQRRVKGLEVYHFGEASDPRALEVAARENGTPLEDNAPDWRFILADKLNDKKIEDSQELAWKTRKAIVPHLRKRYKVKDHGVKTAPFYVLRMTTMPGILAEVAFVSNPTEEKLLTQKAYQQRVAEGLLKGIQEYITPLKTASR
jgi:N-acetylmuramoyl-L-alanine amidase